MSIALPDIGARAARHITRGALPNGVTWSLWSEPRDPLLAINVWVRAGSADEEPGATGSAHFLEHLMFRGTQAVPDGAFDAEMERMGALINAATWIDSTFYATQALPAALRAVLALEADRFAGLSLTDEVVSAERRVVANERRQVVDAVPEALLHEALWERAQPGSPYAWPVIGWADDIEDYSPATASRFFARCYAPGRIHVSVVGPLEPRELSDALEATFGALADGGAAPPIHPGAPNTPGARTRSELAINSPQPRLAIAWPAPPRSAPTFPAYWLAHQLLAGADASRWPLALEVEGDLALDVHSDLTESRLGAPLTLGGLLREGVGVDDALGAVDAALERLAEEGVPHDERERVRVGTASDDARHLATTGARAEWMGEGWIHFGDARALFERHDEGFDVPSEDVQRVAKTLLEGPRTVVVGVPQ